MSSSPSDPQAQTQQMPPSLSPEAQCRLIVARLRAAYGWSLAEEKELTALVLAAAPPGAAPPALERFARDQYSRVLWQACRPGGDEEHRERAYAELQRYLFRAAYNRRPAAAEECVQRALELVVAQVERCREPGAFLTFALDKLRHALSEETARAARASVGEPPAEPASEPDAVPVAAEERERVETLLRALGRLRDQRQRQTVVLKYFDGLDDRTIGARLMITPNLVRVLRHRALAALRADPALAALRATEP